MNSLSLVSNSARQTQRLGRHLGSLAQGGDVFLLIGVLGAGKTCLTQGIARGLGVEDVATSPTFVVVNQYKGRLPLYHIDLYRLDRIEEVIDLGLDDYLFGKGVCVVEWADKAPGILPQEHLLVEISILTDTSRNLRLTSIGERCTELLSQLEKRTGRWKYR